MKNLFAFVIKHHFVFVFFLLQLVSVWLMYRGRGYQGSQVFNSSNEAIGAVYQLAANTREYFGLRQQNEMLARENAFLRNYLKTNFIVSPDQPSVIRDTLYRPNYNFIAAKVINASINKQRNYITLDAGYNQGVRKDMAVMTSNGIIGFVTAVSANFSSVMSVLNKDAKVYCQLKKDAIYGPLIWDGSDYEHCLLTEIPTHSKMKKGDTVVTSELSGIFPQGLVVGTVERYERLQNESFYTVWVKLAADLKKVNHVYVIRSRYKNERDSLEKETQKQVDD